MSWDYREYLRERRIFLAHRGEYHPMMFATTVIFTVTWLAAWLQSMAPGAVTFAAAARAIWR